MISIGKKILSLVSAFLISLVTGALLSAPALAFPQVGSSTWELFRSYDGSTNKEGTTTWKLIQSFQGAMNGLESRNQEYWWVYLLLMMMVIGVVVYLYISQKRLDRRLSALSYAEIGLSGDSKRELIRSTVKQELYYSRSSGDKYRSAYAVNISGGGILFATSEKFQQNDVLKVVLELSPGEVLRLRARVVRVSEQSGDGVEPYLLGVQFINITNSDQDKIVKKIIKAQQGSIIEEKRKSKRECVFCGQPIPDWADDDAMYCPKCMDYE